MDTQTGGSYAGRDASAGRDWTGRDKHEVSVGDAQHVGAGVGNRIDIHTVPDQGMPTSYDGKTQQEAIREIWIALLGDKFNHRNNPGLVHTVEMLSDKFASLVAANAAQSYRSDLADNERKAIRERQEASDQKHLEMSKNQQTIIASITEYRQDNDERMDILASRQTSLMVMLWVMLSILLVEGTFLIYLLI